MKKEEIYTKLFKFSSPTFYNWQREKRPIIQLLEKYFDKEDLEEFLHYGSIAKLDYFKELDYEQDSALIKFAESLYQTIDTEECDRENGIEFLAHAFSSMEYKTTYTLENTLLSFMQIQADTFFNKDDFSNYAHLLGSRLVLSFDNKYKEKYAQILGLCIMSDFRPLIKVTTNSQYDNIDIANFCIKLCIKSFQINYPIPLKYYDQLLEKYLIKNKMNEFNYTNLQNELNSFKETIFNVTVSYEN